MPSCRLRRTAVSGGDVRGVGRMESGICTCTPVVVVALSTSKNDDGNGVMQSSPMIGLHPGWASGGPDAEQPASASSNQIFTRIEVTADRHGAGCTIVLPASVTAVCASNRPLTEVPVPNVTNVWAKTIPSTCAVAPAVTEPLTCQNTLFARAPPASVTDIAALMSTSPATWKIHTSGASPSSVTSSGINRPVLHLYTAGASVMPPMFPAPSSSTSGVRAAALVNAVAM